MARMIGMVQGQRGQASRLGNADSGVVTKAQGWRVGVTVYGRALDDKDEFHIYATGGSNGGHADRLIGVVTLDENGRPTFTAEEANS